MDTSKQLSVEEEVKIPIYGEWQLCPKCNGEGQVYGEKGTPGLTNYNIGFFTCPVCNGSKVIQKPIIGYQSNKQL